MENVAYAVPARALDGAGALEGASQQYHATDDACEDADRGAIRNGVRSDGAPTHNNLMRLANILRRCDLFIGDDSFPMHMATAVGTPVVAIFGPSNHLAWGPYRARSGDGQAGDADRRALVVRRNDLVCSPCLYRGHALGLRNGCAPRPCLNELGTDAVIAAARRLLLASQPTPAPR